MKRYYRVTTVYSSKGVTVGISGETEGWKRPASRFETQDGMNMYTD